MVIIVMTMHADHASTGVSMAVLFVFLARLQKVSPQKTISCYCLWLYLLCGLFFYGSWEVVVDMASAPGEKAILF